MSSDTCLECRRAHNKIHEQEECIKELQDKLGLNQLDRAQALLLSLLEKDEKITLLQDNFNQAREGVQMLEQELHRLREDANKLIALLNDSEDTIASKDKIISELQESLQEKELENSEPEALREECCRKDEQLKSLNEAYEFLQQNFEILDKIHKHPMENISDHNRVLSKAKEELLRFRNDYCNTATKILPAVNIAKNITLPEITPTSQFQVVAGDKPSEIVSQPLTSCIKCLFSAFKDLRNDYQQLKTEYADFVQENKHLQSLFQSKTRALIKDRDDLFGLYQWHRKERKILLQTVQKLEKLPDDLKTLSEQNTQLYTENTALKQTLDQKLQDFENRSRSLTALNTQNLELNETNAKLDAENSGLQEEISKVREEVSKQNARVCEMMIQINSLCSDNANLLPLQTEVETLRLENSRLLAETSKDCCDSFVQTEEKCCKEADSQTANANCDNCCIQTDEPCGNIDCRNSAKEGHSSEPDKKLLAELEALRRSNVEVMPGKDRQIADLKQHMLEISQSFTDNQSELRGATYRIAALEEEKQALDRDKVAAQEKICQLEKETNDHLQEIVRLMKDLKSSKEREAELKDNNSALTKELETVTSNFTLALTKSDNELKAATSNNTLLEDKLRKSENQVTAAISKNTLLQGKLRESENAVRAAKSKIASQEGELKKCKDDGDLEKMNLKAQVESRAGSNYAMEQKINKLLFDCNEQKMRSEKLEKILNEERPKYERLQKQLNEEKQKYQLLQMQLCEANTRLEKSSASNSEMQWKLNSSQDELSKKAFEFAEQKRNYEKLLNEGEQNCERLQNELNDNRAELQKYLQKIQISSPTQTVISGEACSCNMFVIPQLTLGCESLFKRNGELIQENERLKQQLHAEIEENLEKVEEFEKRLLEMSSLN